MGVRQFAAKTTVPVAKSRLEVETLLTKNGATSIATGWTPKGATVLFEANGLRQRVKPKVVIATFCPFCGVKYTAKKDDPSLIT